MLSPLSRRHDGILCTRNSSQMFSCQHVDLLSAWNFQTKIHKCILLIRKKEPGMSFSFSWVFPSIFKPVLFPLGSVKLLSDYYQQQQQRGSLRCLWSQSMKKVIIKCIVKPASFLYPIEKSELIPESYYEEISNGIHRLSLMDNGGKFLSFLLSSDVTVTSDHPSTSLCPEWPHVCPLCMHCLAPGSFQAAETEKHRFKGLTTGHRAASHKSIQMDFLRNDSQSLNIRHKIFKWLFYIVYGYFA